MKSTGEQGWRPGLAGSGAVVARLQVRSQEVPTWAWVLNLRGKRSLRNVPHLSGSQFLHL